MNDDEEIELYFDDVKGKTINIDGKNYTFEEIIELLSTEDEILFEKVLENIYLEIERQSATPAYRSLKDLKLNDEINKLERVLPIKSIENQEKDKIPIGQKYIDKVENVLKELRMSIPGKEKENSLEQVEEQIEEFHEQNEAELAEEFEELDQAPLLVLWQKVLGLPEKKKKKGKGRKLKKSPLHLRFLKMFLSLVGRLLALTSLKSIGQNIKLYLLNQLLAKIEHKLRKLDPKNRAMREYLEKLIKKVKKAILKERLGDNLKVQKNANKDNKKDEQKEVKETNKNTDKKDHKDKHKSTEKESNNKEAGFWDKLKDYAQSLVKQDSERAGSSPKHNIHDVSHDKNNLEKHSHKQTNRESHKESSSNERKSQANEKKEHHQHNKEHDHKSVAEKADHKTLKNDTHIADSKVDSSAKQNTASNEVKKGSFDNLVEEDKSYGVGFNKAFNEFSNSSASKLESSLTTDPLVPSSTPKISSQNGNSQER